MPIEKKDVQVLFVCMGNICRSPAAEGILKHRVNKNSRFNLHIESCGIGDWHIGQGADKRMQEAAKGRGVVLASRARQFQQLFFDEFDYIFVSDNEVLKYLYRYAKSPEHKAKIFLMTAFSLVYKGQEVPDPYYQPNGSFEVVLDILEDSCEGFLKYLESFA